MEGIIQVIAATLDNNCEAKKAINGSSMKETVQLNRPEGQIFV